VQNTKKKKKKKKKGLQNHTPKNLTEGGITDERNRKPKKNNQKENSKPPGIVKKQGE
jgi:hypothetical protein